MGLAGLSGAGDARREAREKATLVTGAMAAMAQCASWWTGSSPEISPPARPTRGFAGVRLNQS